ncbi:unnamed protein product [Victoria cruziana]
MERTYQYAWIIPFVPLLVTMLIGLELLLNPTATKNIRRIWAFPAVLLLSIVMVFSTKLAIQQINGSSIYEYLWSWSITSDFSLEFGYLIDPLTSIMSILITTVGIMVLIYSDNYMSHDRGYLRFFAYMSFFNTAMLGLVTSPNLIQIHIFWELVGMCSYLLIGFWFTRPIAANACQKAFVTNRVGDFGLLLGILGFYLITGSFEFQDLFEIFNDSIINNNEINSSFATLCAFLLFLGAVAKSAQFPLHVWLPDAMEGPTPISALIHAATMSEHGSYGWFNQIYANYKNNFFLGTLSLCGIPPLACFWSKDEILNDSWLYSPIFAIIDFYTAGLTAFYMFRMYLLTFEGHLRKGSKPVSSNLLLTTRNNNDKSSFSNCSFSNTYKIAGYVRTMRSSFSTHFLNKDSHTLLYPHESNNTMLFPLLILAIFTLFVGCIGIHFGHEVMEVDILSKWLTPSMKLFHENSTDEDWYKFLTNAFYSVSIPYFGIFIASVLYGSVYLDRQNLYLINSFAKIDSKIRICLEQIINVIYNWSYNRGYIDVYYEKVFIRGVRGLAQLAHSFDRRVIDGVTNGIGVASFFLGEGIKYIGGGRISSYLFLYLACVSIVLVIYYYYFF